jgi:hypothetical protein
MNCPRLLTVVIALLAASRVGTAQSAARTVNVGPVQSPSLLQQAVPFEGEWRIVATQHFDIAFVAIAAADLERIADVAERTYRRTSGRLAHELSFRPLIVVFRTRADLNRAIASRTFPGNREHLLLALDDPAAQTEGDFAHELMHVLTFDIVPPSARRDLPGWLHEGFAELERGTWAESDLRIVRDLLRANTLPTLGRLPREGSADSTRLHTIIGHLAFDFLAARGGMEAIKKVLVSLRDDVNSTPMDAYLAAIGLASTDFDREFERWVRSRFAA